VPGGRYGHDVSFEAAQHHVLGGGQMGASHLLSLGGAPGRDLVGNPAVSRERPVRHVGQGVLAALRHGLRPGLFLR